MSFDPNDPRITAYVLDELDADERKAFESALSASGDLQQAVEATRQATEQLACELRTEPPASLSGTQRESVLRAARERDAQPSAASVASRSTPAQVGRSWRRCDRRVAAGPVLGRLSAVPGGRRTPASGRRGAGAGVGAVCRVESGGSSTSFAVAPQATPSDAEGLAPATDGFSRRRFSIGRVEPSQDGTESVSPATMAEVRLRENATCGCLLGPGRQPRTAERLRRVGRRPGRDVRRCLPASPAPGYPMSQTSPMGAGGYPGMPGGGAEGTTVQLPMDAGGHSGMRMVSRADRPWTRCACRADYGRGPGLGGDKYLPIVENPFKEVKSEPLSTFSIDVDTASYSKVRMVPDAARRAAPAGCGADRGVGQLLHL